MITQAPCAFLLVKLAGSPDEPITTAAAEQMFTKAGQGTLNVVDWFDENSHGNVDMSGNEVFGWLQLADSLAGYQAKLAAGTYGRTSIIDLGRAAATAAQIDLSKFSVVVVVTNVGLDLFGGMGFTCCTAASAGKQFWELQAAPSVLCQEMIHGLGVYEHTRRDGSDADYADPYDVMSMFAAYAGHHPNYPGLPIGPGLNAAFMQRCGWLDPTRVAPLGAGVTLRPLHRRDLPGALYARVGSYFVEYRPAQRWDVGFTSVVLVHYIKNNTSYLVTELQVGSPAFAWGDPLAPFSERGSIQLDAIDDAAGTATITTSFTPARRVPLDGPALSLRQSEFVDAGGLVFLGGKIVRIPPRSPELQLVETAAALVSLAETALPPALDTPARAELYARALAGIQEAHEHVTGVSAVLDHISLKDAERFQRQAARAGKKARGRATARSRRKSR
jgi:hypothetical protein